MYIAHDIEGANEQTFTELALTSYDIKQEIIKGVNSEKDSRTKNIKVKNLFEKANSIISNSFLSYQYWKLFYQTFKLALCKHVLDFDYEFRFAETLVFSSVIIDTFEEKEQYEHELSNIKKLIISKQNFVKIKKESSQKSLKKHNYPKQ